MQHDFELSVGQPRFQDYLSQFQDYCVRADEFQRLADRYPAFKAESEMLASQWRGLALQVAN